MIWTGLNYLHIFSPSFFGIKTPSGRKNAVIWQSTLASVMAVEPEQPTEKVLSNLKHQGEIIFRVVFLFIATKYMQITCLPACERPGHSVYLRSTYSEFKMGTFQHQSCINRKACICIIICQCSMFFRLFSFLVCHQNDRILWIKSKNGLEFCKIKHSCLIFAPLFGFLVVSSCCFCDLYYMTFFWSSCSFSLWALAGHEAATTHLQDQNKRRPFNCTWQFGETEQYITKFMNSPCIAGRFWSSTWDLSWL